MKNQSQTSGQSRGGLAELKSRLLFVVIGILIYRLGAHISSLIFLMSSKIQSSDCLTCFLVVLCPVLLCLL